MHEMTRASDTAKINAPFAGEQFDFKADHALASERDGQRYLRIASSQFGDHEFRVTKIIGGHHREDFAGVEGRARAVVTTNTFCPCRG